MAACWRETLGKFSRTSAEPPRPRMFSQWVRGMGAPLGRLSWAQVSGVVGRRSRDRTARSKMRMASTGKRKRAMAVYQFPTAGCAARKPAISTMA